MPCCHESVFMLHEIRWHIRNIQAVKTDNPPNFFSDCRIVCNHKGYFVLFKTANFARNQTQFCTDGKTFDLTAVAHTTKCAPIKSQNILNGFEQLFMKMLAWLGQINIIQASHAAKPLLNLTNQLVFAAGWRSWNKYT